MHGIKFKVRVLAGYFVAGSSVTQSKLSDAVPDNKVKGLVFVFSNKKLEKKRGGVKSQKKQTKTKEGKMKNFFCNILFMGVLCFGFSAYSQSQNSEWKTCLSTAGVSGFFMGYDCIETPTTHIHSIQYEENRVIVYLKGRRFVCLNQDWVDGRHCQNRLTQ